MNVSDSRLCLQLHSIPALSDTLLTTLLLHYGSPRLLWESNPGDWAALGASKETRLGAAKAQAGHSPLIDIDAQLASLGGLGAQVISVSDAAYPPLLRKIYDPPPFLYLRGSAALLQQPQLAVVGSRKASPAGLRATRLLSGQLTAAGLHICSGLAQGIDAEAHRAALNAGGSSIAVMATGIDVIYPHRHRELAEQLASAGCLVTEYPPGCQPERYRFPQRNRILSGLSLGVLVVEAALRSGSLITATAALEQGREVFTLPWAVFHQTGRGCLKLIREGAKMVESVEDILEELGPLYALQRELFEPGEMQAQAVKSTPPGQHKILAMIGYEVVAIDELVRQSELPVAAVMAALSALELEGQIARCAGGYIHC
ncbi:MAG: DNA-protecting protein DprA [Proteobacteria bacterium]|nr:DNA-protecting protein DprA [Pseudomonadota bacterium]